jgi:hypothetical protein
MISQQTLPSIKLSSRTLTGTFSSARTNAAKESGQPISGHDYSGQIFQGRVHRIKAPDDELQWVYVIQSGVSGRVVHKLDASKVRFTNKEGNPIPIEEDKVYTFTLPKRLEIMSEEGLCKHCAVVSFNDYIASQPLNSEFKGTVRHIANGKGAEKKGTLYVEPSEQKKVAKLVLIPPQKDIKFKVGDTVKNRRSGQQSSREQTSPTSPKKGR